MAEVLSQSQIDALLNGMLDNTAGGDGKSGGEAAVPEKSPEKKYRKYDFYSPKKFTKDRLKMLKGVYDTYSRITSSRVNGLLRVSSDIEVVAVEEQRYYEFSNALSDTDILTLVDVKVEGRQQDLPVLAHTTMPLMLNIFDRMLGGDGTVEDDASGQYTDIEIGLYRSIMEHFVSSMADAWANYLDLSFDIQKVETNPSFMQNIGLDETIIIIVMNIEMDGANGQLNICMPGDILTNVFIAFDKISGSSKGKKNAERVPDEIFGNLKTSALEVVAELSETEVLLSDVYNLHVGDVINLNKHKDSDIVLYIENEPWFKGKLGVQNKNMAVKISGICERN